MSSEWINICEWMSEWMNERMRACVQSWSPWFNSFQVEIYNCEMYICTLPIHISLLSSNIYTHTNNINNNNKQTHLRQTDKQTNRTLQNKPFCIVCLIVLSRIVAFTLSLRFFFFFLVVFLSTFLLVFLLSSLLFFLLCV